MPATAGRTRRPHNNRVSTSGALKTSDIWSKTIGHDPYAPTNTYESSEATKEKSRAFLELARQHQNQLSSRKSGGASKDDFAQKLFLGLKSGKKRLNNVSGEPIEKMLKEDYSSSSEDEFVEVQVETSNDVSSQVSYDSHSQRRHKKKNRSSDRESKKRRKSRKKKKRISFSSSDSDDYDSVSRKKRHSRRKKNRCENHEHKHRRRHNDEK